MIQKRLFQPLTYFGDQKHARTRTHFYLVDVRKRSNELWGSGLSQACQFAFARSLPITCIRPAEYGKWRSIDLGWSVQPRVDSDKLTNELHSSAQMY